MTDRLFLRLNARLALGADSLQWILYGTIRKAPPPFDAPFALGEWSCGLCVFDAGHPFAVHPGKWFRRAYSCFGGRELTSYLRWMEGGSKRGPRRVFGGCGAMTPFVTMRDFLTEPQWLGTPDLMAGDSWRLWRILLIAIRGEPLEPDELADFGELTGRLAAPCEPVKEFLRASEGVAASRELAPCWRFIFRAASTIAIIWRQ